MNSLLLISFTVIASAITVCDSAKILAVLPVFAKSHHYVTQPFIKELAARGHDITFYTPIPLGKNYSNVKEVEVHVPLEKILLEGLDFQKIRDMGQIPWVNIISFWFMGLGIMDGFLEEPRVQKLIHSNEKYDLVILETHFANEALLAFGHKFNAPVVSLATFSSYIFIDEFLGNPYGTAYIPGFELPYTTEMSFFQRVHNTVRVISTMLVGYYFYLPYQESFMRKYFNYTGSEAIPSVVDMLQDVSLVITNSHLAVDYPRPWVPNVIGVAGLHINQERTPLPKDLKDFMDNSKNGVIYVSFGSLVPSHQMPPDMKEAFVKTFSKLKQNVLWRFPADSFPDLPKNVKISKWLPQQDVLAHPNMKAFITHGGLLSQEEAVYFAVPLIGVPFFGDQYLNVERSAAHGYGIPLDQYNITEKSLTWAINEIINNPSYRENIKQRSKIFRDNPQRPIDKAMFWIEYVIRHKGAPHLRSEGRKLPWFKYLLLDVVAFLLLASFLVLYVIYFFIKCLLSLCKGKPKPQVKSTKKKN